MKARFFEAIAVAGVFTFATSCSSNGSLKIPGEDSVIEKNIVSEYMNIAKAYEDLKNYSKAVEYYRLASQADTHKVLGKSAMYSMARTYALAKDWKNAEELYISLLEEDTDNTNLRISLAYISAMSGNLDQACKSYQELCEKNPTDKNLLKNYISVLVASEKMEEADIQFQKLVENFPGDDIIKEVEKIIEELKTDSDEGNPDPQESSGESK